MKTMMILIMMFTLFACNSSDKTPNVNNRNEKSCNCEKTFETDSIVFATNVRIKMEAGAQILLFNCAAIETGIASLSDETGENEREKYIYEIRCVSTKIHSVKLGEDFKYFKEAMQSQEDFFEALKGGEKPFFEFTLEDRKIRSVLKLDID
ncbi:hypothetical protein EG347_19805 [Chryseobacterium sp. G0186]|uniref:hypothetical protein n=1 Tax=Chryseobacterium sp. G0186 TaxID=2487064 RepID=UPI000F4D4484|nr:hypothetical protein [Chryseobacterium sp. G0186]AZA79577.1 hypothetical protein EG347_19805 [Chryseobacterium sp. G0186]